MSLSHAQLKIGTLQASRGRRYLAPATLPPAVGLAKYDDPLEQYLAEVEQMRKDAGAKARVAEQIRAAMIAHPEKVYQARIAKQPEPKDRVPALEKKRDEVERSFDVSEHAVCTTSDTLQALREDDEVREYGDDLYFAKLEAVASAAEALNALVEDLAEAQYFRSWLYTHKPSRTVEGREHLTSFRRKLAQLTDRTPVTYVSPAAMAQLRAGNAVEDRDGNRLTFEEADALSKRGKLKVSYGQLLPRGAGMA